MGAWGYGPLQNDTADDWILDIGISCSAQIEAILTASHDEAEWEEVRAACWLLEKLGTATPDLWASERFCLQLRQGIDWLTWLRDESGWNEDWNKPDDLQKSLDEQIASLAQMLAREEADTEEADADAQE